MLVIIFLALPKSLHSRNIKAKNVKINHSEHYRLTVKNVKRLKVKKKLNCHVTRLNQSTQWIFLWGMVKFVITHAHLLHSIHHPHPFTLTSPHVNQHHAIIIESCMTSIWPLLAGEVVKLPSIHPSSTSLWLYKTHIVFIVFIWPIWGYHFLYFSFDHKSIVNVYIIPR